MNHHDQINSISKSKFPNGHALIIAISAYNEVKPLPPEIANDARAIREVLTAPEYCGYDPQNITLLLNEQATLEAIRRELDLLASRSSSTDTVCIYFSGHGANLGNPRDPISALVPVDCKLSNILKTVLMEEEFSASLTKIQAQRLVVFIDACHSGGAGSLKSLGDDLSNNLGFNDKTLGRLAQGTGRVIIASSRASETSLILHGASNSLFTEHLVRALKGAAHTHKDGLIRIFDVFNYVSEKVQADVPGKQHPIFKASDLEENFPVALDCGGMKSITPPLNISNANESVLSRQLEDIFSDLYPAGPQDQEIWVRAGGDISRLRLNGTGRVQWFSALRTMQQGGGGQTINKQALVLAALQDFPHHQELKNIATM
ncbi:caspase family protein [Aeromonas jandaei]|uniref:caspase family protein n=1 Tax=Aeromonas jandaei TaxID=650 RepID=UPI0039882056